MTVSPVMTVTDELLAEIEEAAYSSEFGVVVEAQSLREALNELRRLRAENAELWRQNGMLTTAVSDVWKIKEGKIKSACLSQAGDATNWQAEEISRLNVETAELAKDAGRYRWIKAQGFATIRPENNKITLFTIASQPVDAQTLDSAIDTAMAAQ